MKETTRKINIRKNAGMTNISRMKKDKGWNVRIERGKQVTSLFFSDTKFCGEAGSLKAAQEYRDRINEQVPLNIKTGYRIHKGSQTNKGGGVRWFWNVSWDDANGKLHNKRFGFSDDREEEKQYRAAEKFYGEHNEKNKP